MTRQIAAPIVALFSTILWFTGTDLENEEKVVLSGVLLAIAMEYFVLLLPGFVVT